MIFWGLGIRGAAWASNLSDALSAILIYLYIVKYKTTHPSWIEWEKATLKSLGSWVKSLLKVGGKYYI
jgi:Na+-driven multidrug efflux pump